MKNFLFALLVMTIYAQKKDTLYTYPLDEAVKLAMKNDKYVLVFIYTDWCGSCQVMRQYIHKKPYIFKQMNYYYYYVEINAESKDTLYLFGTPFVYNPESKVHELVQMLAGGTIEGYPMIIILNNKKEIVGRVQGYLSEKEFQKLLYYIPEGHYLIKSWEEYLGKQ